jgi:hypothetical protein
MLLGAMSGVSVANADITSESKSHSSMQTTYQIENVLGELDSVYSNDKIDM